MKIDSSDIGSVVTGLYAMISGPKGARDYKNRWQVYHETARLMRTGIDEAGRPKIQIMTPEDHARDTAELFAREDFYEVEIAREVKQFGNIAQVWSIYEMRRTANGEAYRRGINTMQLARDASGAWRVISILWDNEREGLKIPNI
jgi:hypothetical protein